MNKKIAAELEVYLDSELTQGPTLIGRLFSHQQHVWFRYARDWINCHTAFALDPDLALGDGDFHPDPAQSNFGVFLDSSPDRWGQTLMDRREQIAAKQHKRRPRTLYAWDYLIGVQDLTRMGALRFRMPGDDRFLDHHPLPAPPVTELRTLEAIASNVASRQALNDLDQLGRWLAVLVAPGASLGGARPKANFRDADGSLWIAKFPSRDDQRDYGAWEKLVHDLARDAGIEVPQSRMQRFASPYHTFCVKRFDRTGQQRHFMLSAMTALRKSDGNDGSYTELLEFIQEQGAPEAITANCEQLFRRIIFNVLVGNRDDHLRNHAFLLGAGGWRLTPAYDVTPCFDKEHHVLKLDGETTVPSIDVVLATADFYDLSPQRANAIVDEVAAVVSQWRERAQRLGIARGDIELTASAFSALDERPGP